MSDEANHHVPNHAIEELVDGKSPTSTDNQSPVKVKKKPGRKPKNKELATQPATSNTVIEEIQEKDLSEKDSIVVEGKRARRTKSPGFYADLAGARRSKLDDDIDEVEKKRYKPRSAPRVVCNARQGDFLKKGFFSKPMRVSTTTKIAHNKDEEPDIMRCGFCSTIFNRHDTKHVCDGDQIALKKQRALATSRFVHHPERFIGLDEHERISATVFSVKDDNGIIVPDAAALPQLIDNTTLSCQKCQDIIEKRVPNIERGQTCCEEPRLVCTSCNNEFTDMLKATTGTEHACWQTRAYAEIFLYKCQICVRKYRTRKALLAHLQMHRKTIDEEDTMTNDNVKIEATTIPDGGYVPGQTFVCDRCDKQFAKETWLAFHKRRCMTQCDVCYATVIDGTRDYTSDECRLAIQAHVCDTTSRRVTATLKCDECDMHLDGYVELMRHKNKEHGTSMEIEEKEFSSMEEFEYWRETMQCETGHRYSRYERKKLADESSRAVDDPTVDPWTCRQTYHCARARKPRSKTGAYREKFKDRLTKERVLVENTNMGEPCPAFMKVTEYRSGRVRVMMMTQHNHQARFDKTRTPKYVMQEILNIYPEVPSISYVYTHLKRKFPTIPITRHIIYNLIRRQVDKGIEPFVTLAQKTRGLTETELKVYDSAFDQAAGLVDANQQPQLDLDLPHVSQVIELKIPSRNYDTQEKRNNAAIQLYESIAATASELLRRPYDEPNEADLKALHAANDYLLQLNRMQMFNESSALRKEDAFKRRHQREQEQQLATDPSIYTELEQGAIRLCADYRNKSVRGRKVLKNAGVTQLIVHADDDANIYHVDIPHVDDDTFDDNGEQHTHFDTIEVTDYDNEDDEMITVDHQDAAQTQRIIRGRTLITRRNDVHHIKDRPIHYEPEQAHTMIITDDEHPDHQAQAIYVNEEDFHEEFSIEN